MNNNKLTCADSATLSRFMLAKFEVAKNDEIQMLSKGKC